MIDARTLAQPKVTVYGTRTCPYCTMAKRYLNERGISYEEIDVSESQQNEAELIAKSGQRAVPVIEIGHQIIVGFNRAAIDDALMLGR